MRSQNSKMRSNISYNQ